MVPFHLILMLMATISLFVTLLNFCVNLTALNYSASKALRHFVNSQKFVAVAGGFNGWHLNGIRLC